MEPSAPEDGSAVGDDDERLAAAALTALRVLAINDDIVQATVALGILPIVTRALQLAVTTEGDVDEKMMADVNRDD